MVKEYSNKNESYNPTDKNKLEAIFRDILTPIVEKHAEKLDKIIENNKLDTQEEG